MLSKVTEAGVGCGTIPNPVCQVRLAGRAEATREVAAAAPGPLVPSDWWVAPGSPATAPSEWFIRR